MSEVGSYSKAWYYLHLVITIISIISEWRPCADQPVLVLQC